MGCCGSPTLRWTDVPLAAPVARGGSRTICVRVTSAMRRPASEVTRAEAVQTQQAKVAESVSKGHGKRLAQRQRTLVGLEQELQAVQPHQAQLAAQATALGPPRERADRDFRKQTIMTIRTLLLENALTSFMAVLLGLLTMKMSLDCLLKILFERSGARVVTDSQVIYWVNTAGLSGPYHLWYAKILSSRLWTMPCPPATISKKEYCSQL